MGREQKVDPIFGLPLDEDPEPEGQEPEEGASTDAGPEPQEGEPASDQAGPEEGKQAAAAGEPAEKSGESKPQRLIAGKFKSYEDLEKSYKELERKLGARDAEKDELRRRLDQLEQVVARFIQAPGIPPSGPVPAQPPAQPVPPVTVGTPPAWLWISQGSQAVQSQPVQAPAAPPGMAPSASQPPAAAYGAGPSGTPLRMPEPPPEPQETPEVQQQWLERFYGEPVRAVRDLIREEFERQWYRQGLALGQMLAPYVGYVNRQMLLEAMGNRVARFREAHPDLDEYQEEFLQVLRERPDLAARPPEGDSDPGLEAVYQLAKARKLLAQANQQHGQTAAAGQQAAPTTTEASKRAARMPAPTGARTLTGQKSPEDEIREAIFGAANETQGVFD